MKVTVDKEAGELVIRLPIQKDLPKTKSGKSLMVASTYGPQRSDTEYNGETISVLVNAYIRNPDRPAPRPRITETAQGADVVNQVDQWGEEILP